MAELNESNPYVPTTLPTAESQQTHKVPPKLRRGISTLAAIIWNLPFIVFVYLRIRGDIDEKTMDWLLPTWALILPIGAILLAQSAFVQRLLLVPGSDVQNNRVGLWAFAGFWTVLLTIWYTSLVFKPENPLEKLRNRKKMHEQSIAPKSRIDPCLESYFTGRDIGESWRYRTETTDLHHDIERLIEHSSIDGPGGVPMSVRRSAFAAVAGQSNFAQALSHPVCHAVIMIEPKSFFDGSHWPDETKLEISNQLHDSDSVILLSLMTSDIERTEHFTGGGVTYDFVIHPKSFAIIHTALGSWLT
jgi:hypothetical protein